jgi:hypothetical protein
MTHLLEQPLGKGCCGGCHVPYTVVILLRVNEQYPILDAKIYRKAKHWLQNVVATLEKSQLPNGGWDKHWTLTEQ